MLTNFVKLFGGDPTKKVVEQYSDLVDQINALEPEFEKLSDQALRAKTEEFKARLLSLPSPSVEDPAQRDSRWGGAGGGVGVGPEDKESYQLLQDALLDLLPQAFALVREASKRTIGLRHYDVQLIGGIVLHRGEIAEMKTGEGKTLVATLPLYLNALTGRGTHLVTVNDYLARRDARWMAPIFDLLGLTVGVLQMAAVTENGKKAFLVDFERESPHEDQHHLRMVDRVEAYAADVTYGTNSEFGFDYLRDNMTMRLSDRVQRGHHYAIVDEVDNVLIDEARTPLIISGPASGDLEWYGRMAQLVKQLKPEDYEVNEKDRNVSLSEVGTAHIEALLGQPLMDPERPEDVTPEQARLTGYLEQALRSQFLFHRNKDYLVQGGKVIIVDEFTGRLMPGRRWSDGLHQAVEAKEGVKVEPENVTYATITLQNYFRMYQKLAGMTGTALTEAEEFNKIYKLEVASIPTNLEYQALSTDATLIEQKARDDEGYPYIYYVQRQNQGTPSPLGEGRGGVRGGGGEGVQGRGGVRGAGGEAENKLFPPPAPVRGLGGTEGGQELLLYKRKDYPDVIYRTVEAKLRAIIAEIVRYHVLGRPMLVGTTSVESSERLSNRLKAESIRRLMQLALVRRAFMQANNREEDGRLVPELVPFNEPLEVITPDALRKFSSTNLPSPTAKSPLPSGEGRVREGEGSKRGTGSEASTFNLSLDDPENLAALLEILRLPEESRDRLKTVLQAGVPHQVLNARKHTEESQIIAGAGAFGAVTIATNMAGRGVDIKLGGELAEEVIASVNRVLRKAGHDDPFDMPIEEKRQALQAVDPSNYGIYDAEVKLFLQYFEDMERVKELGGLHVIGSERHEARRIDNQLRGRSARQGDPGSSRFYLSLEDDLMRLFGGAQVSGMMERLKVDDSMPLEARLVGSMIEGSQHRVEGANFDVRKHLLEYDDVLNKQRAQIYSQRDRIFVKEDLSEDINEMLASEVARRVELGMADEEGPWKLIAWLEQIQPPFESPLPPAPARGSGEGRVREGGTAPSPLGEGRGGVINRIIPTYGLTLVLKEIDPSNVQRSTLNVISRAIQVEEEHLTRAIEALVDKTAENLDNQIKEREDSLDTYFDNLRNLEEQPRPQKMVEELSQLVHIPLRLNTESMKTLADDPEQAKDDIATAIAQQLTMVNAARLIGAIQNRLGEALPLPSPLPADWDELEGILTDAAHKGLESKRQRLLAQLERDIDMLLQHEPADEDSGKLRLLMTLSQGARTLFDQRTHKQVKQVYARFTYVHLAAQMLEGRAAEDVTEDVLRHLERALLDLQNTFGHSEYSRLSQNAARLGDFGPAVKLAFGEERLDDPVESLGESDREALMEAIGKYVLNEVHRQLLLGAITELWVDYLTKVEALRVSIGLEAYAQRDPLVQYKGRASEMFQQLLEDVRALVISRAFAARPRRLEITPLESVEAASPQAMPQLAGSSGGKKRKRKRH